jgi:hypothetical protein
LEDGTALRVAGATSAASSSVMSAMRSISWALSNLAVSSSCSVRVYESLSENAYERASRLAMRRIMATRHRSRPHRSCRSVRSPC